VFSRVKTVTFSGIKAICIEIETHLSSGIPSFVIVGLAAKTVAEAKERVRSALLMMGLSLPAKKVTVNLSPSDLQKDGNHYDLGICIGSLVCMGVLKQEEVEKYIFMGELSLDGSINYVTGILPAALFAKENSLSLVCPLENITEARCAPEDLRIISPKNIEELIDILKGDKAFSYPAIKTVEVKDQSFQKNFSDVKGQKQAKRALEIASIGGHDVLMVGRPGSGKSMLAERFAGILPALSSKEMLEVSIINSISGNLKKVPLTLERPFRNPHHSSSMVSMVGGGKNVRPGEISLAHNGVLFLDEFAEFPSFVLDSLRGPMESNQVNIARAEGHVSFPCKFQLIAAMNPCKCGYLGDPKKECSKVPFCGENYTSKISGPILERIDIHLAVNPHFELGYINPSIEEKEETSAQILERVIKAQNFAKLEGQKEFLNAKIPSALLEQRCKLTGESVALLNSAALKFNLSLRQCHKTIRIARTIADMEFSSSIGKTHLLEALQFRQGFKN
jgi:magnesium chelatase family protein